MYTSPRPIHLLVVESNPADSYLMVEGLRRAGLSEAVTVVEDSEQALAHLSNPVSPDLIFLDLNVAPMSGLDFLRSIRSDPHFGTVPVIIVSGSENRDDVRKAYESGANCYVAKPSNLDEFFACMKICYDFWSSVVTLPPRSPA